MVGTKSSMPALPCSCHHSGPNGPPWGAHWAPWLGLLRGGGGARLPHGKKGCPRTRIEEHGLAELPQHHCPPRGEAAGLGKQGGGHTQDPYSTWGCPRNGGGNKRGSQRPGQEATRGGVGSVDGLLPPRRRLLPRSEHDAAFNAHCAHRNTHWSSVGGQGCRGPRHRGAARRGEHCGLSGEASASKAGRALPSQADKAIKANLGHGHGHGPAGGRKLGAPPPRPQVAGNNPLGGVPPPRSARALALASA